MPKQITDNQVYQAVIDTLIKHGYAGATTKRIAQSADINEVTLFRKYGNKAQLVASAVASETDGFPELPYTGDVAADLVFAAEAYLHRTVKHAALFPVIMSELTRFPELRTTLEGPVGAVSKIRQLIMRYQTEGVLAADEEPLHAVAGLIGPLIVINMLRSAARMPIPVVEVNDHVTRYLQGRQNMG